MTELSTLELPVVDAQLGEPLSACFFCEDQLEPVWVIRYEPCSHNHLACDRCQRRIEIRQLVNDGAIPPRPYATHHVCCGAAPILRATWTRL